jgi:hypothetical protein
MQYPPISFLLYRKNQKKHAFLGCLKAKNSLWQRSFVSMNTSNAGLNEKKVVLWVRLWLQGILRAIVCEKCVCVCMRVCEGVRVM